ncbi:L-threonylcarbamoyladenylate synthase [Rubrobacter marinus]|uniref:L-threonylcarbamoyladenylate synthase n=1 Tax=Rubrobacter marinus TaxID=2653852 RepID=UPI00140C841F|nr:L-threonylcarbamoyladenylate synthase [Rubrobacter marinus]
MRTVAPREAAELLRGGGVGLVPTETVVGLVAGETGLDRLAGIKGRDPTKPIALLCPSAESAFGLASRVPPVAEALARSLWPGPLTLVLDREDGGTIGVRVPDHPTVRELLAEYGSPLYATSANPAGGPAPATLDGVDPVIRESADFAVAGESGGGEASAVVDLSGGRARILRPGAGLDEATLSRMMEG